MPINQLTEYEKSIDMDLKLDCNGNEIKNVADPTEAQSVATKNYVDNQAGEEVVWCWCYYGKCFYYATGCRFWFD